MFLDPVIPAGLIYLLGGLALLATAVLYWREAQRLSPVKNIVLLVFRTAAVALIVLLLLQPSRREEIQHSPHTGVVLVAIDSSQSMAHADDRKTPRLQRVREILDDADVVPTAMASAGAAGAVGGGSIRFFHFSETAEPLPVEDLGALSADGGDTQFHTSIETLVDRVRAGGEDIDALLILSDGHDFELAGIDRTARIARFGRFPIYTVAVGSTGRVHDIATRIANYQPYAYVGQDADISAILRVIGADFETLTVQLLRNGELVDSRRVATGEESEITVRFTVNEDEPGQYPYEIRVLPMSEETDPDNNSAVTFLNVIDQKMRALMLEGEPYWDTTFLQRSLYRNDKIDLDVINAVQDRHKLARLRNDPERGELPVPEDGGDFAAYNLIVLGRGVDRILELDECADDLRSFVEDAGGTLIFARGHPLGGDARVSVAAQEAIDALQPMVWEASGNDNLRLEVVRDGRALAPFRLLVERQKSTRPLPPLTAGRRVASVKPLTAVMAEAHDPDTDQRFAAIAHRRVGRGQVLSIGVSGLWRWGFSATPAAADGDGASAGPSETDTFDQFWDQTVVWLLAQSESTPSLSYSFRANTANLALGEALSLRFSTAADGEGANLIGASPPLAQIFLGNDDLGEPIAAVQLDADANADAAAADTGSEPDAASGPFYGEFVPERTGRYLAQITLADGTKAQVRFMVYNHQPELTEVATDVAYLRKLATATGGQLLQPNEIEPLFQRIVATERETEVQYELVPIWNQAWVFYLIVALLGVDWYLRRRWGLT